MAEYNCRVIVGDNYAAEWPVEAFSKAGVLYTKSDRDRSGGVSRRSAIVHERPGAPAGNPKLISQFASLEWRTFPTGRERIDPGPGHDDLANSAAISLSLAGRDIKEMTFHVPHVVSQPRNLDRFVSVADYGGEGCSAPPGGWPMSSPQASGLGGNLSWYPGKQ